MPVKLVPPDVRLDEREARRVSDLGNEPAVLERLVATGREIAEVARGLAPKRTGAGAASIEAQLKRHKRYGHYVEVSWDKDHFYMGFHELGTEKFPARPFLRPAAQQVTGQTGVKNTYNV